MTNVSEGELQAKAVAPRVTFDQVNTSIVAEHYFTAYDAANTPLSVSIGHRPETNSDSLKLLTFCVLTLENGFTVTGESACAAPENFDADIGRRVAREKAVDKIWPLLGYELRTKLMNGQVIVPGTGEN